MFSRSYRKHKSVIDWFYNSPTGSTVLLKKGGKWIVTSAPSFSFEEDYLINDEYIKVRLALHEGKEVKIYDKETDYLEPLYNKDPNQMFYYKPEDYRIFDKKEEESLKFEYKPKVLKEEEVYDIETCMLDIALYNIREMTEDKLREYLANEANPEAGMVYGLTYPEETELVAHVFYDEIFELLRKSYKESARLEIMSSLISIARFAWVYFTGHEEFVDKVVEKARELDLLEEDEENDA